MRRKHFSTDEILTLHRAAVQVGLGAHRGTLLGDIHPGFVASMAIAASPSTQILTDLHALNDVEKLTDGTIPMAVWLKHAVEIVSPRPEEEIFRRHLERFGGLPSDLQQMVGPSSPSGGGETLGTQGRGMSAILVYAREDERYAQMLRKHLRPMELSGKISLWDHNKIPPGAHIDREIKEQLAKAELVLALVSADLLASDELYRKMLEPALRRHGHGLKLVPILLRPADYWRSFLGSIQPLPVDNEPLTSSRKIDDAFIGVVQSIHDIVAQSREGQASTPPRAPMPMDQKASSASSGPSPVVADPVKKLPHFLDACPYPWSDPSAQKLHRILVDAFPKKHGAGALASAAGVDVAHWNDDGAPITFWRDLLEVSALQGKTRSLVEHARKDRGISGFHQDLETLING
ncbi:MAG: effector-associated domain EAD1-containing protein [Byssovorax sp.]